MASSVLKGLSGEAKEIMSKRLYRDASVPFSSFFAQLKADREAYMKELLADAKNVVLGSQCSLPELEFSISNLSFPCKYL